jgi:hypothetical protein
MLGLGGGVGLVAIFTILFVAPLVLGFWVAAQRVDLRSLRGFIGGVFLLFLAVVVFGVVATFGNINDYNQWSGLAIRP